MCTSFESYFLFFVYCFFVLLFHILTHIFGIHVCACIYVYIYICTIISTQIYTCIYIQLHLHANNLYLCVSKICFFSLQLLIIEEQWFHLGKGKQKQPISWIRINNCEHASKKILSIRIYVLWGEENAWYLEIMRGNFIYCKFITIFDN